MTVHEQIRSKDEVEDRRENRREPAVGIKDSQSEYQPHQHRREIDTAEHQHPNAEAITRSNISRAEVPCGARKPCNDEDLRGDERGIRQNAAMPGLERRQKRRGCQ